jgi:hypothetical protein
MSFVIPLPSAFLCGYSRITQEIQPEQLTVFLAAIFADNHKKHGGVAASNSRQFAHHVSRSDRLFWGNQLVAGLGSQIPTGHVRKISCDANHW